VKSHVGFVLNLEVEQIATFIVVEAKKIAREICVSNSPRLVLEAKPHTHLEKLQRLGNVLVKGLQGLASALFQRSHRRFPQCAGDVGEVKPAFCKSRSQ
jgi:hypothetical protein